MSDDNVRIKCEINIVTKCSCCLNNEAWRSMWKPYEYNDIQEVYGQMLMECFALSWDIKVDEMICVSCVNRLRDAVALKIEFRAVQELLQENFLDINKKQVTPEKFSYDAMEDVIKASFLEDEIKEEEYNDSLDSVDSEQEETRPNEVSGKHSKRKRPMDRRLYKTYSRDDIKNAKEAVRGGAMTIARAAEIYGIPKKTLSNKLSADDEEKDEERDAIQEKNLKLYEEIKTIIEYTNALPFKTKTTKYYCAYCSTDGPFFEDPIKLRKHIRSVHSHELGSLVQQIMRPAWLNEILKIDITNLKCNVCDIYLNDWNKMFIHFAEAHDIVFDEAYTRLIPYSLTNDLKCVLCLESYHNFGQLDAHMNAHYSNYICYECGDTFLANSRLEKHLKVHRVGKFPCDQCDKVFTLELYRSKHINLVHKQLCKVKCLYCPEKFLGTLIRHQHMLEQHPRKVKVMTCELCDKKFTWKPYFLTHMKKAHSKKYSCSKCGTSFTKKNELRNHFSMNIC